MKRIQPDDPRLQLHQRAALVSAADLAEPDEALIRDELEDGPEEIAGVDAGVVAQLALGGIATQRTRRSTMRMQGA